MDRELVCALGCTEPIAVAYAAALARATLGAEPGHLEVGCSGNIIKNVKSVTVPNSGGMRGVEAAAVLGALGGNAESALEVLEGVGEQDIAHARELLARPGYCAVSLVEGVPNLYIRVSAEAAGHTATVVVEDHHTNGDLPRARRARAARGLGCARSVGRRGEAAAGADTRALTLERILAFAEGVDLATMLLSGLTLEALLERQLTLNNAIAQEGLAHPWGAEVGRTLLAVRADDVATRARARAAAGSDARMSGCAMPVVINSGSGNQGITASMPVLEYAETWGVSHDKLLRALVVSDLAAVHLKSYIGSLSAFCGVVCAAAGAGAARLLDGRRHVRADRGHDREHAGQRGRHRVRRRQVQLRGQDLGGGGRGHSRLRDGHGRARFPCRRGPGAEHGGGDHRQHGVRGARGA